MEGLFCPTPVIPFGCVTSTILKGEAIATPGISLLITSFKPLHGFSVLDTKQEDNARLPADFTISIWLILSPNPQRPYTEIHGIW